MQRAQLFLIDLICNGTQSLLLPQHLRDINLYNFRDPSQRANNPDEPSIEEIKQELQLQDCSMTVSEEDDEYDVEA